MAGICNLKQITLEWLLSDPEIFERKWLGDILYVLEMQISMMFVLVFQLICLSFRSYECLENSNNNDLLHSLCYYFISR